MTPEQRDVELVLEEDRICIQSPDRPDRPARPERPALSERGRKRKHTAHDLYKLHAFALLWARICSNYATLPFICFEEPAFIADRLAEFGFEMDCGHSLEKAFPDVPAFHDSEALKQVLNQVDMQTLGNAIYSKWRYLTHWAISPEEEADFDWFVLACTRLADLAKDAMERVKE